MAATELDFAASLEQFAAMKEAGIASAEIYRRFRQQGNTKIDGLRLLRAVFGLSLEEAREVSWEIEGRPESVLPKIRSAEELRVVLSRELGRCSCAGDVSTSLRDFLQLIQDRTDAREDQAEFSRVTRLIESRVDPENTSPFGSEAIAWMIFALEQKGFLWHGFQLSDLWINPKGRGLLAALKELPLRERASTAELKQAFATSERDMK